MVAAGSAVIVHEGVAYSVDQPEVILTADAMDNVPPNEQRSLRVFAVDNFLRVRRVGRVRARVGRTRDSELLGGELEIEVAEVEFAEVEVLDRSHFTCRRLLDHDRAVDVIHIERELHRFELALR